MAIPLTQMHHTVQAKTPKRRQTLTLTGIGILQGGSSPRLIIVEWLTLFTVRPGSVVLTGTHQTATRIRIRTGGGWHTSIGVSIALATVGTNKQTFSQLK